MAKYLLPNLKVFFRNAVLKIWYVDTDYSVAEEHLIFKYMEKPGPLTIVPGSVFSEDVILILIKGDVLNESQVLSAIKLLLGPMIKSNIVSPSGKYQKRSNSYALCYGPDLKRIPTTFSQELTDMLKSLKINDVLRVEIGRNFSFDTKRQPSEITSEIVYNALVAETSNITWGKQLADEPLNQGMLQYVDDMLPGSLEKDKITIHVMGKVGNSPPIAQFVAHLPNLPIPSTSIATTLSLKASPGLSYTGQTAAFHYGIFHNITDLSFMVQQLQALRMQRSILLDNTTLMSTVGGYYSSKSMGEDLKQDASVELYQTLTMQCASLGRCNTPIVSGFWRVISTKYLNIVISKSLIFQSILASAIGSRLAVADYGSNQLIIALGSNSPCVVQDMSPYYYQESVSCYNKICQTIHLFRSLYNGACISSTLRDIGQKSVKDHLFALLKNSGANIYLSTLPPDLTFQLKSIPQTEWVHSIEYLINEYYFNLYSNVFFMVIDPNPSSNGQHEHHPLELLHQAAKLYECEMAIIGHTVPEDGIHIFNDLSEPFRPQLLGTQENHSLMYSIFKRIPPNVPTGTIKGKNADAVNDQKIEDVRWSDSFSLPVTIRHILLNPTVGSKSFIVHHVDRCNNGHIVQQQGVGALDLPLSNYSLAIDTLSVVTPENYDIPSGDWKSLSLELLLEVNNTEIHKIIPGHCCATGEQAIKMSLSPSSGAKLAMTEVLTNIMFGPKMALHNLILTASVIWDPTSDLRELTRLLFECKNYAKALGVKFVISSASSSRPGDQRLLSHIGGQEKALNNIVFTGCCPTQTLKRILPVLKGTGSLLVHIPIEPHLYFGGTLFETIFDLHLSNIPNPPASKVVSLFTLIQENIANGVIKSGHDVSDGGLVTTLIELSLSTDYDVNVELPTNLAPLPLLLSETPGAVIEIDPLHLSSLQQQCQFFNLPFHVIGNIRIANDVPRFTIYQDDKVLYVEHISELRSMWSHFSNEKLQRYSNNLNEDELYKGDYGSNQLDLQGLAETLSKNYVAFYFNPDMNCRVALLTWPGMATGESLYWAFINANFDVYTVCINEIKDVSFFDNFRGLAICGVLGHKDHTIGTSWAALKLQKKVVSEALYKFFKRKDTFSLGCGYLGFRLISAIMDTLEDEPPKPKLSSNGIILEKNSSGLYESRWLNMHIANSSSIMLKPITNMTIPCWVQGTHLGLSYTSDKIENMLFENNRVACTYSDAVTGHAHHYPRNPTGSSVISGICSADGRHLALLFDPSLSFFTFQWQHIPESNYNLKTSPWSLMFYHAHIWCYSN